VLKGFQVAFGASKPVEHLLHQFPYVHSLIPNWGFILWGKSNTAMFPLLKIYVSNLVPGRFKFEKQWTPTGSPPVFSF
jgi:hypothetical protein